jgi:hypothetical protein
MQEHVPRPTSKQFSGGGGTYAGSNLSGLSGGSNLLESAGNKPKSWDQDDLLPDLSTSCQPGSAVTNIVQASPTDILGVGLLPGLD